MQAAVVTLKQTSVAVVLVEPGGAAMGRGDELLRQLQPHFPTLPIMLLARDDGAPMGVRAHATFQWHGYLIELLRLSDVEWIDLPPIPDQDAPF